MKNQPAKEDRISQILGDPERVRKAIQRGVNAALLEHKRAGNPVCESRDGKVVWIQPEDIKINDDI